jgi:hypothetical protein
MAFLTTIREGQHRRQSPGAFPCPSEEFGGRRGIQSWTDQNVHEVGSVRRIHIPTAASPLEGPFWIPTVTLLFLIILMPGQDTGTVVPYLSVLGDLALGDESHRIGKVFIRRSYWEVSTGIRGVQIADSGRLRVPPRQPTILNLLTHTSGIPVDRPKAIENSTRTMDGLSRKWCAWLPRNHLTLHRVRSGVIAALALPLWEGSLRWSPLFPEFHGSESIRSLGHAGQSFFPGAGKSPANCWTFHAGLNCALEYATCRVRVPGVKSDSAHNPRISLSVDESPTIRPQTLPGTTVRRR